MPARPGPRRWMAPARPDQQLRFLCRSQRQRHADHQQRRRGEQWLRALSAAIPASTGARDGGWRRLDRATNSAELLYVGNFGAPASADHPQRRHGEQWLRALSAPDSKPAGAATVERRRLEPGPTAAISMSMTIRQRHADHPAAAARGEAKWLRLYRGFFQLDQHRDGRWRRLDPGPAGADPTVGYAGNGTLTIRNGGVKQ